MKNIYTKVPTSIISRSPLSGICSSKTRQTPDRNLRGLNDVRAFTLIELLVVVLIIGILAAVALPQYQKSVWRARFAQLVTWNNAIVKAQKLYFLANGTYATKLEDLDIEIHNTTNAYCKNEMGGSADSRYTVCFLRKGNKAFVVLEEVLQTGQFDCCSYQETDYEGDSLCMAETGKKTYNQGATYRCFTRR